MYHSLRVAMNLPNTITLLRLLATPLLVWLAWHEREQGFLWLLFACLISDVLDGFLARHLQLQSELGSRLDSWADAAIYLSMPLCAWWLWPDLIRAELLWVLAVVASVALPALAGLIKFGQTTSYHTWSAKLAALGVASGALLMFVGGPVWLFRLATPLAVLAALEEIAITCLLRETHSNIPSLWHLLRRQRSR